MINLLINSFAPVAILILIGYISAQKSIFSKENSIAIIKYIGVVAVPALTLKIILSISISNVNWTLIFSYVFSELIIYLTALLIGKYIFNLKWNEAILIGMASSFANHLLFVYPIALNEYEADLVHPIVAIIGFDVIFLVINLIILDLIKNIKAKGKTLIFSTHQLGEVKDIADKIVVIKSGKKVFDGDNDSFQKINPNKNFNEIFSELVDE